MYALQAHMPTDFMRRCSHCGGSGKEFDPVAVGAHMRALRVKAQKSLRAVAKAMKLSPPYISDLERGNRAFTSAMVIRFKEALK